MGYYTRYSLSWSVTPEWKGTPRCAHKPPETAKFCADCGAANTADGADKVVGDYLDKALESHGALNRDGTSYDKVKWYSHEEDMKRMSAEIPGVLFHLMGEGENTGDVWDAFFLNGKGQKHVAKIVRAEKPDPKAWRK